MFLTKTAQAPALAPSDYSDAEVYASELGSVFARSWNVVTSARELAEHGAQIAVEVGAVPVVVRNEEGVLRAYRNVCPHRHALVVRPGKSCLPVLRCQYHGWEFDTNGELCRLPDGRSFAGWKAKGVQLERFRCETAFGLVFVNPEPGTTTLAADWHGIYDALAQQFEGVDLHWTQVTEHDVNWKVVVENAVESYHVPLVHPGTFGNYADEAFHGHVIEPAYTQYHDLKSAPSSFWRMLDRLIFQRAYVQGYAHSHLFPNHLVTLSGFYREWVVVEPLGPRRCRRVGYGFLPNGVRPLLPLGRMLVRELARRTRISADRILDEDSSVWPHVQRGSEASRYRGVLSAREERVTAFQRWLVAQRSTLAEPAS